MDMIKNLVVTEFKKINLDTSLIEKFPYFIQCSTEFERNIQLMNVLGIKDYFAKTANNEIQEYMKTFEFKNIYEGEYQSVFVDPFTGDKK